MSLKQLIFPRSIAFVGGNECEIAIRRTKELGFTGKIHAIHPKREQLGRHCHQAVRVRNRRTR